MKRLLILTALVMLTTATVGCRQGYLWNQCPPEVECDPCAAGPVYTEQYLPPPMVTLPGPAATVGPVNPPPPTN